MGTEAERQHKAAYMREWSARQRAADREGWNAKRRVSDHRNIEATRARGRRSWATAFARDPERFRARFHAWYATTGSTERNRRNAGNRAARLGGYAPLVWRDDAERDAHGARTECEVCLRSAKMYADHCHDCGAYRGALCNACNVFEGRARPRPDVFAPGPRMVAYLAHHACPIELAV